jgi:hypothetical protein
MRLLVLEAGEEPSTSSTGARPSQTNGLCRCPILFRKAIVGEGAAALKHHVLV